MSDEQTPVLPGATVEPAESDAAPVAVGPALPEEPKARRKKLNRDAKFATVHGQCKAAYFQNGVYFDASGKACEAPA